MQVLIAGDSHTGALKRGLGALQDSGHAPDGFRIDVVGISALRLAGDFFQDCGDKAIFLDEQYRRRIPELPLPGPGGLQTVYCWCGLFHFARLWRSGSWVGLRLASSPDAGRPVSRAMIANIVRHWFGTQLALLDVLKRIGVKVIAIESPRPFRHHPALRSIKPVVAAAVDRCCLDLMLNELSQRSVATIRIPSACMDSDGFMHEEWRSERPTDPHHGNASFGALMIQHLCKELQGEVDG